MYSFIDYGTQDFLRYGNGGVIKIEGSYQDAEDWLILEGEDYGWTNRGVRYWNWEEEI